METGATILVSNIDNANSIPNLDQLPSICEYTPDQHHHAHIQYTGDFYHDLRFMPNQSLMMKSGDSSPSPECQYQYQPQHHCTHHHGGKWKETKRRQRSQYHSPIGYMTGLPCSTLPHYYQYLLMQSLEMVDDSREVVLPLDPRSWSKSDVRRWLTTLCRHHELDPALDPTRFPFNGKALCALNLEMIQSRAPLYGKLLYKDVRLRLAKASAMKTNFLEEQQNIVKI